MSGPPAWRTGCAGAFICNFGRAARVDGAARGTARARPGSPESNARRMRGNLRPSPPAAAGLGQAALAGVRPRRGARPELRRRSEDHCGDPGTAADWEDAHTPGAVGTRAAALSCPWSNAASGLTIPIHRCSGAALGCWSRLRPRVCGTDGCGPVAGGNPLTTPERTLLGCAFSAQQMLANSTRPARSARVAVLGWAPFSLMRD